MPDSNFFKSSINTDTGAEQSFTEEGQIDPGVTLAKADTNSGDYKLVLPNADSAVGDTVVVVVLGGGNILGVVPATGDTIDGLVASVLIGSVPYDFGSFISMGADGWLQLQ